MKVINIKTKTKDCEILQYYCKTDCSVVNLPLKRNTALNTLKTARNIERIGVFRVKKQK